MSGGGLLNEPVYKHCVVLKKIYMFHPQKAINLHCHNALLKKIEESSGFFIIIVLYLLELTFPTLFSFQEGNP